MALETANMVFRRAILGATTNRAVRHVVNRYGMSLGASRFVAGETLDDAVRVLLALEAHGFDTNTTLLGEHNMGAGSAAKVVKEYESILERIAGEGLRTNVSLKLTQIGLADGEAVAHRNVERLVRSAAKLGNFIRIDMEDSQWVDTTLRIYRRLREAGHHNVGTVLQAYLRRSERDLESLADLQPRLRLVKGAYLEPVSVAYQAKPEVDAAYVRLIEAMLSCCEHTAVATHDERLIAHAIARAEHDSTGSDRLQFQMLFGIQPALQLKLVRRGHSILVATPFGPDWYAYMMRRLAERPANLIFLARNMVRRDPSHRIENDAHGGVT